MNQSQCLKVWLLVFLLFTILNLNQMFWRFLKTDTTLTRLNENSTTVRFNINSNHLQSGNKQLLLAVGVLNRLSLKGRRNVIRMTWFKQCKKNPGLVKCNFFTDSIDDLKKTDADKLLEEQRINNDMEFMPIKGCYLIYLLSITNIIWHNINKLIMITIILLYIII